MHQSLTTNHRGAPNNPAEPVKVDARRLIESQKREYREKKPKLANTVFI